jgi:hypothetical protein
MSDFYQILKREIEPDSQKTKSAPPKTDEAGIISAVENFKKKTDRKVGVKKLLKKVRTKKEAKLSGANEKDLEKISGEEKNTFLSLEAANPVWLTMAETAKIGGIKKRTIKRALRAGWIKYKISEKRYQVDFRSALLYLRSKKKLWNKLKEFGLGQYVEKWKN